MRLFRDMTEGRFLSVRNTLPGKREWLNPFQRAQLKRAQEQQLPSEFIAVITTGYSDMGRLGTRSAREMRHIRRLLAGYRMRFSCISLLALSDECLSLYAKGFERDLPLRDIRSVVSWYQKDVRRLQDASLRMGRRQQKKLLILAYEDAMRALSHYAATAA